jgi:hypothetical protein
MKMSIALNSKPNCRVHLSGGSVTTLAEKHRGKDGRPSLPGPRRTSPAGDANVRCICLKGGNGQ